MGGGSCGRCRDCADRHPILGRIPGIGRAFRNDSASTSRTVSKMESYDAETADLLETVKIQQALTEFRVKSEKRCDSLEESVLRESREYIDDLVDFLKSINEKRYAGKKLHLNIERIERSNRETEDIIRGYIKKNISKRVSLDDEECVKVLRMDSGEKKEQAMMDFLNNIIADSMKGLTKEINKSLQKQIQNIEDQIEDRVRSNQSNEEDKLNAFREIEEIKSSGETKLEEKIIEIQYKHGICGLGTYFLQEEN